MTNSIFTRGLKSALENYLNEAVDNGLENVYEIKKYAESKYRANGHRALDFISKMELYKEYFGEYN